jgi:hypothetical protein
MGSCQRDVPISRNFNGSADVRGRQTALKYYGRPLTGSLVILDTRKPFGARKFIGKPQKRTAP